ncbi:MAG: putative phosphothreonine lyase domain-containing protein [Nitrososphaerales archaeon]
MTELKDAIHEYQEDLSDRFSESRPSQVTEVYWIYASRKKTKYPKPSRNSGKWLVFEPVERVNEVWGKIKKATEDGKLGRSSKVATARVNPNAPNPRMKVICVYTYDWTDEADVKRIREALRSLGITQKIPYKSDEDTMEGKYVVRGDKRISKYYE